MVTEVIDVSDIIKVLTDGAGLQVPALIRHPQSIGIIYRIIVFLPLMI